MSRPLTWVAAVLGLVLVAAGVALFVAGNQSGGSGWTAYGPVPPAQDAYQSSLELTFDGGPEVLWTPTSALGAGIALLGLLVLTGLTGWVAGFRAGRRTD